MFYRLEEADLIRIQKLGLLFTLWDDDYYINDFLRQLKACFSKYIPQEIFVHYDINECRINEGAECHPNSLDMEMHIDDEDTNDLNKFLLSESYETWDYDDWDAMTDGRPWLRTCLELKLLFAKQKVRKDKKQKDQENSSEEEYGDLSKIEIPQMSLVRFCQSKPTRYC